MEELPCLLPVRSKPFQGESLASWFVRNAILLGIKPYTLAKVLCEDRSVLTRDIDNLSDRILIEAMAAATGTEFERAVQTSIGSLEHILFKRHLPHGKTPWVLRAGVFHRDRRAHGQMYCGACLRTDRTPFYRLRWRLAFSTACTVHQLRLRDRCPHCQSPLAFHRISHGSGSLSECISCGFDFAHSSDVPAEARIIAFSRWIETALHAGWAKLGDYQRVPTVEFMEVVRQLTKVVTTGTRSSRLRQAIYAGRGRSISISSLPPRSGRELELLTVDERYHAFHYVSELLKDWPQNLVDYCATAGMWRSWLLRDLQSVPPPLSEPVHTYLSPANIDRNRNKHAAAERTVDTKPWLSPLNRPHGYARLRMLRGSSSNGAQIEQRSLKTGRKQQKHPTS